MGQVNLKKACVLHLKNIQIPLNKKLQRYYDSDLSLISSVVTEDNVLRFEWRFWNPTYKEVRHVPAYDEMVLFAAIGGYSGMVLGLSFLQIPDLLKAVFQFFLHCYSDVEVSTGETKKSEITESRIARMS